MLPQQKMKAGMQSKSSRVALGGIVAALCVTAMFLTGVLPALYIAAPMGTGMLMLILVEEVSVSWAWLTYVAVSLLSMIVTFDKEAALMFVLFFGYYPILRMYLEKIPLKALKLLLKQALFNIFIVTDYWITVYILGLPTFEDTMTPANDTKAVKAALTHHGTLRKAEFKITTTIFVTARDGISHIKPASLYFVKRPLVLDMQTIKSSRENKNAAPAELISAV